MGKAKAESALSSSRFSDKKLLLLMSILVVTFLIDSQIGYIADFIPERLATNEGIALFIGIAVVFAIGGILTLAIRQDKDKGEPCQSASPSCNPHWSDYCTVYSDSDYCICNCPDTCNSTIQHCHDSHCSLY